jgi:hypothetical protein
MMLGQLRFGLVSNRRTRWIGYQTSSATSEEACVSVSERRRANQGALRDVKTQI